jgi:N-acetylglucosaminyldiphosphoundecaprenol N-acetyl-beta-D-mannosaminyltransferase
MNYYLNKININYINKKFTMQVNSQIKFVTTLNTEILLTASNNKKLFTILNSKNSIVTVDGQWLVFALKRKYANLNIKKNSGSDLIYSVCKEAKKLNKRVLILGTTSETNKLAVEKLRILYKYDDIYGFSPPFSDYPFSEEFNNNIQDTIEKIRPNIIITAFGVPKQEFWAFDNKEYLEKNGIEYIMFFGGAVDMVAGKFKRAPKVLQKLGLEGVYRLILEPKRIRRYYKLLKIIPLIIFNKL